MKRGRAVLALVAMLSGPSLFALCSQVSFDGVTEWYGGRSPQSLTFANINGDRWPDVIVASWDSNGLPDGGLVVLAGDGGRSWRVIEELVPAQNVTSVVAADFDGDGDDDVACYQGNTYGEADSADHIRILMNEDGHLHQKTVIEPGHDTFWDRLLTGDFNGDGRADLVYLSSRAALYLSRGDGTFIAVLVPVDGVFDAAVGDLNGDGRDELVASSLTQSRRLTIFSYEAALRILPDVHPYRVSVADFDGDGAPDILASEETSPEITVFLRPGKTTEPERRRFAGELVWREVPEIADLDGDGADDLVQFDFGHGLRYLHGGPSGVASTGVWTPRMVNTVNYGPGDIDSADVDLDGDLDLALVTNYGFAVVKNDGAGRFAAPPFATFAYAVGDFNRDGRDDLVDQEGIRLAGPGGTFEPSNLDVYRDIRFAGIDAADVNNDGKLDLVQFHARRNPEGTIAIRLGNGDGTSGEPLTFNLGDQWEDRAIADFDGDGNLDVLVVNFADNERKFSIAFGDGHGGFSHFSDQPGDSFLYRVAAGDLDGDGDVDLAVGTANRSDNLNLLVAWNDGHGVFAEPVPIGELWGEIEVADFNGDGRLDVLSAGWALGAPVQVHLNEGGGAFRALETFDAGIQNLERVHIRDFNRDGYLDLVLMEDTCCSPGGWMSLVLGKGDGTFAPPVLTRSTGGWFDAVGDFNGDGASDLLDGGFVRLNSCTARGRRAVRH